MTAPFSAELAIQADTAKSAATRRVCLRVEGLVQGVGYRPYVWRLATSLGLSGWVHNSADGATAEIEGPAPVVAQFLTRIEQELPPLARFDRQQLQDVAPQAEHEFVIRDSVDSAAPSRALVYPDTATCADCRAEITTTGNRRYRYPFTNCTNCGPRLSIVTSLPYDRTNTTMSGFTQCDCCLREYTSPADRRYHAQANACPECGPRLTLCDSQGKWLAHADQALRHACAALRAGKIVAIKGLGGYQLLADARNHQTVARLRERKARPDKPFALMAPGLSDVMQYCLVSRLERAALVSREAPIVLLRKRAARNPRLSSAGAVPLAPLVAPNVPELGFMLPGTPLHHLMMSTLGFVVVATSGNRSESPIATDDKQALQELGDIADLFLTHDRPIACPVDDSVVRIVAGRVMILRRARGYAPMPVSVEKSLGGDDGATVPMPKVLALGGHQKSSIALLLNNQVLTGPHIGDLDSPASRQVFDDAVARLQSQCAISPDAIACDAHPDYYSSMYALRQNRPVIAVQHHVAHVLACIADNQLCGPVLGVAWDGSGYSPDATLWGGEFILIDGCQVRRLATLRPFGLPGGDAALREPRRSAIGLLFELMGPTALKDEMLAPLRSFAPAERELLRGMLITGLNTPRTSSVGRLFDAVASLTGLLQETTYQGQAAMAVECSALQADSGHSSSPYDLIARAPVGPNDPLLLDWGPLMHALINDIRRGMSVAIIAAAFQQALVRSIVTVARLAGQSQLVLTGGCFQNRYVTEAAVEQLRGAGFTPYWHDQLPPNDGSLAVGQALWAARLLRAQVN